MKGNFHVQFLGEGVAATSPPYPTPGWATTQVYPARFSPAAEQPTDFFRDVRVLAAEELRSVLDNGHAAAEAAVRPGRTRGRHTRRRGRRGARVPGRARAPPCSSAARHLLGRGSVESWRQVPRLRKTRSPASTRVPPSLRCTSSLFAARTARADDQFVRRSPCSDPGAWRSGHRPCCACAAARAACQLPSSL